MDSGPYEKVLEALADIDAHLAGLEVGYSEENATAAQEDLHRLESYLEGEPDDLVALREAVETIVDDEDSTEAPTAKEHVDRLREQIEEMADDADE